MQSVLQAFPVPVPDAPVTPPPVRPARPQRPTRPLPLPANDNPAIRQLAKRLTFGAFLKRLIPIVGTALTAYELYELWKDMNQDNPERGVAMGPWTAVLNCNPPGNYTGYGPQPSTSCWSAGLLNQSSYQARVGGPDFITTTSYWTWHVLQPHPTSAVLYPFGQVFGATRYTRATTNAVAPVRPAFVPQINPNIVRNLPPASQPVEIPRLEPPQAGRVKEWQWNTGARPAPRHARVRRSNVRERKSLSRSARVGIALFKALDWISEAAEVVDALYDALPADVKRRWSKGREDRGLLDTAGQYGIDGADWKLQALYHNWHRLDVREGVRNILKNEISDKVIGRLQSKLPKNIGQATDAGSMEFAQMLDDILDRLLPELKGP